MSIHVLPQLRDNYAYLVVSDGQAAVVDPAEAELVIDAVEALGVPLVAIWNTHHHFDHTGGNEVLAQHYPGIQIVGPAKESSQIPGLTRAVQAGDLVALGDKAARVLDVGCHTRGHLAYAWQGALFSGDTLFAAGCGRFFEGTADDMYRALYQVLAQLPDETLLYCGHEYTENNLLFAASLEPEHPAVLRKLEQVRRLRAQGEPSVPTTLGEERAYNPFLRVHEASLQHAVRTRRPEVAGPVATLAALRALKDVW